MEKSINIKRSVGEHVESSWWDAARCEWRKVTVPCMVYHSKEGGDLPLYKALLMAAQDLWPYMQPAKAALLEANFTIAELCKVKEPPMLLDFKALPKELELFCFEIGTSRYESGAGALFQVLNGIRAIARQGTRDKFRYERGKTATEHTEKTEAAEAKPTFAELLRRVLLAA